MRKGALSLRLDTIDYFLSTSGRFRHFQGQTNRLHSVCLKPVIRDPDGSAYSYTIPAAVLHVAGFGDDAIQVMGREDILRRVANLLDISHIQASLFEYCSSDGGL